MNVIKPLVHIPLISDNFISELRKEDLQTLATSLKTLDLSGNSLTSVPEGIFWDLQRLETLDLSRNNIIQIHSMAFQNGVCMIQTFNLDTDYNLNTPKRNLWCSSK